MSGSIIRAENFLARADLSLASLWSGMALTNAGLGAVHGFAAPIGGGHQLMPRDEVLIAEHPFGDFALVQIDQGLHSGELARIIQPAGRRFEKQPI